MKQMDTGTQELGGRMPRINIETHYVRRHDRVAIDMRAAGVRDCVVFGHMDYRHGYPAVPLHVHDRAVDIVFCTNGAQPYRIGEHAFTLRAGDVTVVPPGTPHSSAGHPSYPGSRYWLEIVLPEHGAREWLGMPRRAFSRLAAFLGDPPAPTARFPPFLEELLSRMLEVLGRSGRSGGGALGAADLCRVEASLVQVLFCLADLFSGQERPDRQTGADRVRACIRLAEARPSPPSLAELCARLHASRPVVTRMFRTVTGCPPYAYFQRRRIERAQDLLREGRLNVLAIAHACGYATAEHFAAQFKKTTGLAPSAFVAALARQNASRTDGQT